MAWKQLAVILRTKITIGFRNIIITTDENYRNGQDGWLKRSAPDLPNIIVWTEPLNRKHLLLQWVVWSKKPKISKHSIALLWNWQIIKSDRAVENLTEIYWHTILWAGVSQGNIQIIFSVAHLQSRTTYPAETSGEAAGQLLPDQLSPKQLLGSHWRTAGQLLADQLSPPTAPTKAAYVGSCGSRRTPVPIHILASRIFLIMPCVAQAKLASLWGMIRAGWAGWTNLELTGCPVSTTRVPKLC